MQGIVLHFDNDAGLGVIRAEDGARYRFHASECKSAAQALPGAEIDCEIVDGRAIEIFVLKPAASAPFSLNLGGLKMGVDGATAIAREATLAAAELRQRLPAAFSLKAPSGGLVVDNWQLLFSALSLLFCAAPLLSNGNLSVSLFGANTFLGAAQDQLHQLNAIFGGTGMGSNPWGGSMKAVSPQLAETPKIYGYLLTLGYLVYAVPLSAIVAGGMILRQTPTQGLAVAVHAASCFVPLAILLFAGATLPHTVDTVLGPRPMMSPMGLAGVGVWALVVVGALQFASLRGFIGGTPLTMLTKRAS